MELGWEDIKLIIDIVDSENLKPHLFDEIDYQEVLNRFNKLKEKKKMDKIQKIRKEVERIQLYSQSETLSQILDYIDKVEKEPDNIWKPADGDDLPIFDREVIVFTQRYPLEGSEYAVTFAHRPYKGKYIGKNFTTGNIETFENEIYDIGMTDKVQKIREEIQRLQDLTMDKNKNFYSEAAEGEYNALCNIEHFIDSLQEEPVNEDLEEAAFDYAEACKYDGGEKLLCVEHFKAGAKWQKEKTKRNRTMSRKEDCLGCDRRRLRIVNFEKTNGETVQVYMCVGLLDTPCQKGHGEFVR